MNSNRNIWKDSAVVIMVAIVIAALFLPFEKKLPIFLKILVEHYASIVGYLFLCHLSKKVEVRHLAKVSLTVWAILTPVYLLIYWHLIGTKYTVKSIAFGELQSEIVSVIVGSLIYFIAIKIKYTITIKNTSIKPRGLKANTLLMVILNIAGLIFIEPNSEHLGFQIFLFIFIITISFLVLWYYWQGNNWARILVMLGSILSLINLYGINKYSFVQSSLIVTEAALSLYLLWWLNTQTVKAYFGNSKRDA